MQPGGFGGFGGGFGGAGGGGAFGGGFGQPGGAWGAPAAPPAPSHHRLAQYPQAPGQQLLPSGAAVTCVSIMKDPKSKEPVPYAFACGTASGDVCIGSFQPPGFPQQSLNLNSPVLTISTALIRTTANYRNVNKEYIVAGTMNGLFLIDKDEAKPKRIPEGYQDVVIHAEFCGGYIIYSRMCFENGVPKRYAPPAPRAQQAGYGFGQVQQPAQPAQPLPPDSPIAFKIEVLDTYGRSLVSSPELPCNGQFSSEFSKQTTNYSPYGTAPPVLSIMVPLSQGSSCAKIFNLRKSTGRQAPYTLEEDTSDSSAFALHPPAYGQPQAGFQQQLGAVASCYYSRGGKGAMISYENYTARFFRTGTASRSSLGEQNSVSANLGYRVSGVCYDPAVKAILYGCGNEVLCRLSVAQNATQDFVLLHLADVPGEVVAMNLLGRMLVVVMATPEGFRTSLCGPGALAPPGSQPQPQAGGFGFGAWQGAQGGAQAGALSAPAGQAGPVSILVYELAAEEQVSGYGQEKKVVYVGLVPKQM